jgi:hypothetical protein
VAVDVEIALQTANLTLTEGAGQRVTVPANDRVEVRFPAAAAEVGTAIQRFSAGLNVADQSFCAKRSRADRGAGLLSAIAMLVSVPLEASRW